MPDGPSNSWATNLRINMGCYGGTAEASMPPYDWGLLGDLTNDGVVNSEDFAVQARYWMKAENQQPGDLDRNGIVNTADLALLTEDWLEYVKPPVVNIIKPRNDEVFVMQPAEIDIEVEAWDINGSVLKVEFFVNGRKIAEDTDGSDGWNTDWIQNARGSYSLTATATDSSGVATTSSTVEIEIILP